MNRMNKTMALLALSLLLVGTPALAQQEAEAPEAPNNLRAFTRHEGATAVTELKWQDSADSELGFEILRSGDGKEFKVVGTVGANTLRYEDRIGKYITGAFLYEVRAFNEHGKSEPSNRVSVWF